MFLNVSLIIYKLVENLLWVCGKKDGFNLGFLTCLGLVFLIIETWLYIKFARVSKFMISNYIIVEKKSYFFLIFYLVTFMQFL